MVVEVGWVEADRIGSLPEGCSATAVTSSGHVVAFCPASDDHFRFVWDGAAGEPFQLQRMRDKTEAIFVSPDGAHIAYSAGRGDWLFVGRDEREGPRLHALSRSVPPTFDEAGRHLAYGGTVEGGDSFRLILDDEPTGGRLAPIQPAFSPDGARLAYVELQEGEGEEYRIVLDGEPGPWFLGMRNAERTLLFSPDGRRFAYYSIDGKGGARWTVDGVAQRVINDVRPLGLAQMRGIGVLDPPLPAVFSPDSRRFAYFADVVEKGVAIVEDDVTGPVVHAVGWPVFSPDSKHLAYYAQAFDKRTILFVDGIRVGEWDAEELGEVTFSPDSRRVGATLRFREGGFLRKRDFVSAAVDGQLYARLPGDDVSLRPVWSPDSEHIAWWVMHDDVPALVVDGVEQTGAPLPMSDLMYDSRGRLLYRGFVGDGQSIVIDGTPGPVAMEVAPLSSAGDVLGRHLSPPPRHPFRVSPDGHVAWVGYFESGACPVLDDAVGPAYDEITDCRFEGDRAIWWGRRGTELYRIVHPLA